MKRSITAGSLVAAALLPVVAAPASAAMSGHLAYVRTSSANVLLRAAAGGRAVVLGDTVAPIAQVAITPAGGRVVWTYDDTGGRITVKPTDGGAATTFTPVARAFASGATWSPQAMHVAFVSTDAAGMRSVRAVRPDGSNLRTLVAPTAALRGGVSWGTGGVLFGKRENGFTNIYVADPVTTVATKLTHAGLDGFTSYTDPAWSPAGRRLALVADGDRIVVMDADGSGGRVIATGTSPTWSPDGTRIAFTGAYGQVYTVASTGGPIVPYTTNASHSASWGG
jgi:hypothetical protein